MSHVTYLRLTGQKQGLISAKCSTLESIGNRYQVGHEDEIQVISVGDGMTRHQNIVHHPIQIIKLIDKSSPLLGVAMNHNELLDAEFNFYRTSQSGHLELYYKLKLTKATIIDIASTYTNTLNSNFIMPHQKVSFNYESITWEHVIAGTSGYSIREFNVF